MDIPLGYHKLDQYCATLAHKVNFANFLFYFRVHFFLEKQAHFLYTSAF
jgi:hypothetical protein